MDGDPEYRRFQFGIADLLAVTTVVALLLGTSRMPASSLHAIPLLAVLYVVKFRILTFRVRPWVASLLYFLVVAALLPYLYCRVIGDWGDRFVKPLTTWIGWHFRKGNSLPTCSTRPARFSHSRSRPCRFFSTRLPGNGRRRGSTLCARWPKS